MEEQYYGHLTKHFKELLKRDLEREKTRQIKDLACPRCIFKGNSEMQLLEHYGTYHKVLDFYVNISRNPEILDGLDTGPMVFQSGGSCGECGYSTRHGQVKVTHHQLVHTRHLLAGLPTCQPFVCPLCSYESASRLGLIRHYGQQHGDRRVKPTAQEEVMEEENPEMTMVQVKAVYESPKSTFTHRKQQQVLLPQKSKSLKDFLEGMLGSNTDVDEDEKLEDHGVVAQILRWKNEQDESQKPSTGSGEREPGLSTLSPRHVSTMQESREVAPDTPHSWLCEGRLLQLHEAVNPGNMRLFQQQWDRGQPVLASSSNEKMNHRLWHPKAFAKDFGHIRSDLVNTLTGKTVPRQPLKWFWQGFENVSHRLLDANGTPMLLKLKDWPPDGDIAEYMPKRFNDLVNDFPIQPYTLRRGSLNLASYIPDYCLKPELGPKMYIAYGNALYSNKASTNLHLDMSDAVNLMVYVGIPGDSEKQENIKLVLSQIDEAGCDLIMRRRVRDDGKLPGAIWHIYHPGDTNKIRDLLTRVAIEKGRRLDPHDDPIHDQSTYLDAGLRMRLYAEYGVKGYAIIQCQGDTVFIPCGACHQVRNLHNCIKIAEDFVSPELANNCLHLTQVQNR